MAITPFKADIPCPKCGASGLRCIYMSADAAQRALVAQVEVMRRCCRCCGYEFYQHPADHK